MLRRDVRDPRLKALTITHVKLSPDLSHAWVYYAPVSGDSHDALAREILAGAAAHLRGPRVAARRFACRPAARHPGGSGRVSAWAAWARAAAASRSAAAFPA